MPSGRLGSADIAATTDTTVYTVPASTLAVANLSLCNRTATAITVRVAVAVAAAPVNAEFIEYDTVIVPNGVLERTGIVMDAAKRLVVRASGNGLSANVWGMEEAA